MSPPGAGVAAGLSGTGVGSALHQSLHYRQMMFGTAEPRLEPLDPARSSRAAAVREAVDPERLERLLRLLPAPRVRWQRPEVMADVDAMVLGAFTSTGWPARLRRFQVDPG